jgi:Tol biopolymer transport system component
MPSHTHVEDWTSDGRMLLIGTAETVIGQADLTVLPVDGDRTPKPLLRTPFFESRGRVSPDGRWVAYASDESGRIEVYVQAFPSLEGKWQISTGGGSQPVWSRRGDELFYRGVGSLMAVRISPSASFSPGVSQKLFDDRFYGFSTPVGGHTNYDVSPDGRRFLMVKDVADDETSAAPQIVVVQNWVEELKRLVPTK